MKLSIITPTYNRPAWLEKTIKCILAQNIEGLDIEYIIVDNNCTDNTKLLIEKYIKSNPHKNLKIKYLFEKRQGINFARNSGIEASKGDYILFLDDDITVEQNFLFEYAKVIKKYPDYSIFGSRTKIKLPKFKLPAWLAVQGSYARGMIVSSVELGSENKVICFDENNIMPVGGNMVIKRELFEKYGMFRTDLGLKGKKLLPGSEYELFFRFAENEKHWVYAAYAVAYHPIKTEQAQKHYFRKRLYNVGRVTYRIHDFESKYRIFGLPLYIPALILKNFLKSIFFALKRKPVESFYYETTALSYCGCMHEHFHKILFKQKLSG